MSDVAVGITNQKKLDEEKAAKEKKEQAEKAFREKIKQHKELVAERIALRKGVFSYKDSTEPQGDQSLAAKLSRLSDLSPESLLGEYLAFTFMHLFKNLFTAQYYIQRRAFSEAISIDQKKEKHILAGKSKDDGIRVAYQPIREMMLNEHNEVVYAEKVNDEGELVYPAVYPVDAAGNVDYYAKPNTDGTASRDAIRANGFVPIEDFEESCKIQLLKLRKDFTGIQGMTPESLRLLNLYAEQGKQRSNDENQRAAEDMTVLQSKNQHAQDLARKNQVAKLNP